MLKLSGLVLAAAMLIAGPACAGWEQVEWGMTPEQAAAAMPKVANPDKGGPGDELQGAVLGNKGPYTLGGKKLIAAFYYGSAGLNQVKIWKSGVVQCGPLLEAMLDKHGKPIRADEQSLFKLYVWHDVEENTRATLLAAEGALCSIDYFPLSDWEALDRKKAGLPPRS